MKASVGTSIVAVSETGIESTVPNSVHLIRHASIYDYLDLVSREQTGLIIRVGEGGIESTGKAFLVMMGSILFLLLRVTR
jgi:hypothetical protein